MSHGRTFLKVKSRNETKTKTLFLAHKTVTAFELLVEKLFLANSS